MTAIITLQEEAGLVAGRFFESNNGKYAVVTNRLTEICEKGADKDFLLIHNPGGWGLTHMDELLQWERSIVEGVSAKIESLGYSRLLFQYFRSGHGYREICRDLREQMRFFECKAGLMAAELDFILRHLKRVKVLMIGVSQGAAFSNAVLQRMDDSRRIYDIELGMPFYYKSKKITGERTLALEGNGLMPDALMEWDVPTIVRTYAGAPFRWLKYKLQGKNIKFTYCINVPGHDYNWDYPEVQRQIEDFLVQNFGNKKAEVEIK